MLITRTVKLINNESMPPHATHWELNPLKNNLFQMNKAIVTLSGYVSKKWKTKGFREERINNPGLLNT